MFRSICLHSIIEAILIVSTFCVNQTIAQIEHCVTLKSNTNTITIDHPFILTCDISKLTPQGQSELYFVTFEIMLNQVWLSIGEYKMDPISYEQTWKSLESVPGVNAFKIIHDLQMTKPIALIHPTLQSAISRYRCLYRQSNFPNTVLQSNEVDFDNSTNANIKKKRNYTTTITTPTTTNNFTVDLSVISLLVMPFLLI